MLSSALFVNLMMGKKLLEYTTGELLEKFGAGSHKPGSGSAAALFGMMSVQLIRTVIGLTCKPKHSKRYLEYLHTLREIKLEIEQGIYPALEDLFQRDSDQFDVVIELRRKRDREKDPLKSKLISSEIEAALRPATIMPLEIAEHFLKLAEYAEFVFDHGFSAARGDSALAMTNAISGVAGCLSIIELNLISLPPDEWMDKTLERRTQITTQYDRISEKTKEKLEVLRKENEEARVFRQSIAVFQAGNLAETNRSNAAIEKLVRNLQNTVWTYREKIWKTNTPENYLEILQPDIVLKKVMDYAYVESDWLGNHQVGRENFEIAGLIDKSKKLVQVSRNFPENSRRFTTAHELGHAILHPQAVLHRDKSLDGSASGQRPLEETQADKFATYFLMPSNLVKDYFEVLFQMETFIIDNNTAHYLKQRSAYNLRQYCQNLRGLTKLLASTEYFAGNSFKSLAKIFGVSNTTMAIRLEELELVEW